MPRPDVGSSSWSSLVLTGLNVLLVAAYPLAIWYGLQHFSPRDVGLCALAILLPTFARRLYLAPAESRLAVLQAPAVVLVLIGLAVLLDNSLFMMALPSLVNIVLLLAFYRSLASLPMVERYARMVHPDLSRAEVRHCRQFTVIWCVFFATNATVAAGLALFASFSWWALYTGLLAYGLVGLLFAAEYLVRIARFGRHRQASQVTS